MVTSLVGARNHHVLACTLRFLRSVRLVLKALTTINRDALYLFRVSIASLSGEEGFLRSVRLALEPLMTINRGTLKNSKKSFYPGYPFI